MQPIKVDVTILGTGTAGMGAYRAAKAAGKRVLLLEPYHYGTTCARVGCMPSKLLIAAAEAAHQAHTAEGFGVHLPGGYRVDGRKVMQRVKSERDRFVGFVVEDVEAFDPADRLKTSATLIGPKRLQTAEGQLIDTQTLIVATGSSPFIPEFFKQAEDRLIINDDLFDWDDLPESVAVFGPGVIGLELGQALHRLGVRVRIFGKGGNVGPLQDPKIRQLAAEIFAAEFPFLPDAQVSAIQRTDAGVAITFNDDTGQSHTETFDYLLAATGRRPNLEGLNLAEAGIATDEQGQPLVDPLTLACRYPDGSPAPVFIAGDANNDRPLLHEASDEGRIAGGNAAAWPRIQPGHRRTPLAVVFSDPQIAQAGQTFTELLSSQGEDQLAIGEVSFSNQGRSRVMRVNKGLLRVYADKKTGLLLGAEMLGPRAEHLAHLLAWVIQQQLSVEQLLAMPFYHPVIEEGLRTALRSAAAQLAKTA